MDITYYLFAFYVFLLVCGTIWVYGRVIRRSKTKSGGEEKERQLFRLYQNIEDMLGGFEAYTEEAKADIDERLKQAEALLERMSAAHPNAALTDKTVEDSAPPTVEPDPEETPRKGSTQVSDEPKREDLLSKYVAQGMDKAEIARALGKSQREVSLMMKIKKINLPG